MGYTRRLAESDLCLNETVASKSFISDYKDTTSIQKRGVGTNVTKLIRWISPILGTYKVNTYAAIDSTSRMVGVGIVIRDSKWFAMVAIS
ncbi:hypothetical protein Q3G72_004822 [Acer saccharum]|nr:hypothetical protein Q3G72_004822 [Acer saccharum]